jgi:hypothetical protein
VRAGNILRAQRAFGAIRRPLKLIVRRRSEIAQASLPRELTTIRHASSPTTEWSLSDLRSGGALWGLGRLGPRSADHRHRGPPVRVAVCRCASGRRIGMAQDVPEVGAMVHRISFAPPNNRVWTPPGMDSSVK